jgi:hypothetical protein
MAIQVKICRDIASVNSAQAGMSAVRYVNSCRIEKAPSSIISPIHRSRKLACFLIEELLELRANSFADIFLHVIPIYRRHRPLRTLEVVR